MFNEAIISRVEVGFYKENLSINMEQEENFYFIIPLHTLVLFSKQSSFEERFKIFIIM